ncbi:ring finger protein [Anaeramoeba flamelloides]|uniref:Ring finger protein n=1 Tax=Anaeramoeba flamelloides TaxID=1746091 RepID=A0ABQ8Z6X1_9EUKA|nr:ring finger protein [Anaeramoeba flamelloides]
MSLERDNSKIMVDDLSEQLGSLFYFKETLIQKTGLHDPMSSSVPQEYYRFVKRSQEILKNTLTMEQVDEYIHTTQQKLIQCSKKYLKMVLDSLYLFFKMDVKSFVLGSQKKRQKKKQNTLKSELIPQTNEQSSSINSFQPFIIQTIYRCFQAIYQDRNFEKLLEIPEWTISTLFQQISIASTPAYLDIQRSLFLLSSQIEHFQTITNLYLQLLQQKKKKKNQDLILKYLKSLRVIQFNFQEAKRIKITCKFIQQYCQIIEKTKGDETLRNEYCKTLINILTKFLPNSSKLLKEIREKEKEKNLQVLKEENLKVYNKLMKSFELIYSTIKKWIKKAKFQEIGLSNLVQIIILLPLNFFINLENKEKFLNSKGILLFKLLFNGLKNIQSRNSCLENIYVLINNLNPKFIKVYKTEFLEFLEKELISLIFLDQNKKITMIDHDEIESISQIVEQISNINLDSSINIIKKYLSNEKLRIDYQIALLRSLEKILKIKDLIKYEEELFPLIKPFLFLINNENLKNLYDAHGIENNINTNKNLSNNLNNNDNNNNNANTSNTSNNDNEEENSNLQKSDQNIKYLIAASISTFPQMMSIKIKINSQIAEKLVISFFSKENLLSYPALDSIENYIKLSSEDENAGQHFLDIIIPALKIFGDLSNMLNINHTNYNFVYIEKIEKILNFFELIFKSFFNWIVDEKKIMEKKLKENKNENENEDPEDDKILKDFDYEDWQEIKIRFQSLSLIWLFSENTVIKNKIKSLLNLFNNKEFNELENTLRKDYKIKIKNLRKKKKKKLKKLKKRRRRKKKKNTKDTNELNEKLISIILKQEKNFIGSLLKKIQKLDSQFSNSNNNNKDNDEKSLHNEWKKELIYWVNENYDNFNKTIVCTWNNICQNLLKESLIKNIIEKLNKNTKLEMTVSKLNPINFFFNLIGLVCGITKIPKNYYFDQNNLQILLKANENGNKNDNENEIEMEKEKDTEKEKQFINLNFSKKNNKKKKKKN